MTNDSNRMDFCCAPPLLHRNDCGESYHERHISLRKGGQVCFAPIQHQAPWVLLLDFPEERICPGTPKTIKEPKNTSFSELGYLFSQISEKAIAEAEERLPAGGCRRKRAKTGSFTLNAAEGQPIVGMTDDIVNLLRYFIGKGRISHFWNCDKFKNYKTNLE